VIYHAVVDLAEPQFKVQEGRKVDPCLMANRDLPMFKDFASLMPKTASFLPIKAQALFG